MQVQIREAQPDEFRELWRIDQECFAPGIAYSRPELTHYMQRRSAFTLVAECERVSGERRIVGFLIAERSRLQGHIITLDVREEARRSGLGSSLMLAAEERLRSAGCAATFLEVAVNNEAAIRFYIQRGYTVIKTIPRYYVDKIDALLMGKSLAKKKGSRKATL